MAARLVLVALVLLPLASGAAVWESSGPEGGWVTAVFHPLGPTGPVYAGTFGGGIWISRDGGSTWSSVMDARGGVVVRDFAAATDAAGSIYAATDAMGLLRANFLSSSWTPVNSGLSDPFLPFVTGVSTHPDDSSMVTVSTSNGVLTSRDRGNSWPDSLRWQAELPFFDVEVSPLAPQGIHALAGDQIFFTTDRGFTQEVLATVSDPNQARLVSLALWPGSLDSMVVADRFGGVLQLRDRSSFADIGPDYGAGPTPELRTIEVVEDGVPTIYAGADQGLWWSDDVGQTWNLDTGALGNFPEVWAVAAASVDGSELYLGTFGDGLLRRVPGESAWTPVNDGLRAVWSRGLHHRDGAWLTGSAHGRLHLSTDDGASWNDVTGNLDILQITDVRMLGDGVTWVAASLSGVQRSLDEGATWVGVGLPTGHTAVHRLLQPKWMDPGEVWASTNRGVLRSLDSGTTWSEAGGLEDLGGAVFAAAASEDSVLVFGASGGDLWWGGPKGSFQALTPPSPLTRRYRGLGFVAGTSDRLMVSGTSSGFDPGGHVFRIDDFGGASPQFVDLEPNLGVFDPSGGDLATEPETERVMVALDGAGVYRSLDAGQSWTAITEGLPTPNVERMVIMPGDRPRLGVTTLARGVWLRDLDNIVPTLVRSFSLEAFDGGVRVTALLEGDVAVELWRGDGGGFRRVARFAAGELVDFFDRGFGGADRLTYQLREADGGVVLDEAQVSLVARPRLARLRAARPNPFNPRTTVVYESPGGEMSLDVLDLRGRRVRTLLRGRVEPGVHELVFDGRDDRGRELASGTYLVRVVGERGEDSLRVTLVR